MNIVQVFPGKIWGGAEQYILDLSTALTAQGHSLTYVTRDSEAVGSRLKASGNEYTPLPFRWALDRGTIRQLAEIIRSSEADVVNIHNTRFVPVAILANRLAGNRARVILTHHEAHRTPANIFFRHLFRQLDRIIFVSEMARKCWHGANRWFPEEKCTVVHNSIPPFEPSPVEALRDKYSIPADTPLLVFSGRVRESKGCGDIVRALSMLAHRKFAMVFIGSCHPKDYTGQLQALAAEHNIAGRIHFYGFSSEARQLMSQADIGISPSIVRDSFLLSNIEFQQNGVSIITTDNGGQPEYVTDRVTGLLVSPRKPEELAEAIDLLLTDVPLRKRIGEAGKKYFDDNLSYDKFIPRILRIYAGKA
ncbi:MAG: glycosyltransferase family 4 protein [Duncaniella sp.]|uniref:glycosyltransferase family 4 protein n=1 Tax=Duncaniella sp. TaxID=2518496 RepID=UPI001986A6B9|nr:glycosyltransferase family 4 protein [Duncaniella sp.]MBD5333792.1 glycosyltransferase family 4 protein [Bacteroides sp.]MDE6089387.1 glycosyltransferase family 4 protein [Duncaniella sp.]